MRILTILVIIALVTGCTGQVNSFSANTLAENFEILSKEHKEYLENDSSLTSEQKEARNHLIDSTNYLILAIQESSNGGEN